MFYTQSTSAVISGRDEKVQVGLDYLVKMWQIAAHGLLWLVVAATVQELHPCVFIAVTFKDAELQALVGQPKLVRKTCPVNGI